MYNTNIYIYIDGSYRPQYTEGESEMAWGLVAVGEDASSDSEEHYVLDGGSEHRWRV